ncbi:MAG: hypothetical protein QW607_11740 [Desulfurococcaceae archaeon]
MKKYFIKIVILILYIVVAIPLINNFLMPMIIDFINNYKNMLKFEFYADRYVFNQTSNQFEKITEVTTYDLAPLIILLIQLLVYIIIPVSIVLSLRK